MAVEALVAALAAMAHLRGGDRDDAILAHPLPQRHPVCPALNVLQLRHRAALWRAAWPVRRCQWSSRKVSSSTRCRLFPRRARSVTTRTERPRAVPRRLGWNSSGGRGAAHYRAGAALGVPVLPFHGLDAVVGHGTGAVQAGEVALQVGIQIGLVILDGQ